MTREDKLVERITYLTKIALGEGLNKDFTEFMLQAAIKAAKVGYSYAVDEAAEWLTENLHFDHVGDLWADATSNEDFVEQFRKAMKGE